MAVLDALKDLDRDTAAQVLAAATLASASAPGLKGENPLISKYPKEADAVLSELHRRLHITDASSSAARAKIDRFLGDALRDIALENRSPAQILERMGTAGRLPSSAYRIVLEDEFLRQFRPFAVTRRIVEKTIQSPSDLQHLMLDSAPEDEGDMFSLFVREMHNRPAIGPYWLLVQTTRRGIDLVPQSAWWVHPKYVNLEEAEEPIDVLRAFVEQFGLPLSIEGHQAKFIEQKRFSKEVGSPGVFKTEYVAPNTGAFSTTSFRTRPEWDYFDVGIAYAIDMAKYRAAVQTLGLDKP
ncbi:hypothetical protein [Phenylobacterium sp. J367]|uniref:hypothetical protein n=1 Tax=Phenylobacterium sp. J367 TaxID=2898435 RepID=UPI0021515EB0|nr:hypothetical protein [Phenylobacterium sp. J367]MCR5880699.1 hypothetical protein [Phenylobacterium sp. J367]